jgi:cell division protease FtsH
VNKRWIQTGLYILPVVVGIVLAIALFEKPRQDIETWQYNHFISEVESGRIDRIAISADRTQAKFSNPNGEGNVIVNLPSDPDLVKLLNDSGVDITISPRSSVILWLKF